MRISRTTFALATLLLFIAMAIFGVNASMAMDGHGNMAPCPLMNDTASICPMNVMGHISAWQSLSAAVVPNVISLFFIFAFLLVGISSKNDENKELAIRNFSSSRKQDFISLIFDPIRLALRRGILHTKVYDFTLSVQ